MHVTTINRRLSVNLFNQRRLHGLINELFNDYSKLLVIRLDLYLKSEYEDINTHAYMNQAFTRLRNNLRFNSLFEHYITYAAKLEYGEDRKWHYHVLFFFDGQRVRNDYLLARDIGEYWTHTITRDIGDYYSANMNTSKYQTVAVGMLHYQDSLKIENLKAIANYLVKEDRGRFTIRDAANKAYRSYRQGHYKPRVTGLGRPREYTFNRRRTTTPS
ncbi:inovirus Gp2 family protein [Alcaligenes sp. NLF5-7]|uniref:YagK/YfjJ domain-containing protein n=1 Tax=Alcaligenes sp. NLF5-7 TaxID=2918755 RepID=UPI0020C28C98|nr:inovirus-type Gp2 protein [Alcaligenes sp. NLF5-7]UTM02914.1 inovirus Gp2 family protein [Alcaligenes sp. NLF5-7]